MDLSKLGTQLVKEAEKNPVKAGALGLLTLVALWFWAPLVWAWIRPADATPAAAADATPATAANPAAAATVAAAPEQFDWQGLVRARRLDAKMGVAAWNANARDPFREIVVKAAPVEKPMEAVVTNVAPPPATKSFAEFGLVLQGVMLGNKSKSATISGYTLPLGATFAVDRDGKILKKVGPATSDATITRIEVREIRANEVVLVSEGKEYPLPLRKRSSSSGTIEITRSASGK